MFKRVSAVVLASAALGLVGAQPAVSDGPVADLVGTVAGPTSGSVGDVLTYTVTATNRGPDPGDLYVFFAAGIGTFDLVASDPVCPVSTTVDQFMVICRVDGLAAGATMQLTVQVRVTQLAESAVDGYLEPLSATDPDLTNDAQSMVAFPQPPQFPPPPPPPPPVVWQSFSLTPAPLPHATQYRSYRTELVASSNTGLSVSVVAGTTPPGLTLAPGGVLWGNPFTPGTYTFTIEVSDGIPSQTTQHEYTVVVDPFDAPPDSTGTDGPPASLVGDTILLAKQTKTIGCRRRPLPDRRCSPGAYYSKLTKKVICARAFRAAKIRYVPAIIGSVVEMEYGLEAKAYGATLEIDQIVPAGLGGSNDLANLFPQRAKPAPGYHAKDKLENKLHALVCAGQMALPTAQRSIAADWRALYKRVYGVAPQL